MRQCCRKKSNVGCLVAFGGGLLACAVLPPKVLIIVLGAALVLCGISCGKQ